jgi:hypothetical protein
MFQIGRNLIFSSKGELFGGWNVNTNKPNPSQGQDLIEAEERAKKVTTPNG